MSKNSTILLSGAFKPEIALIQERLDGKIMASSPIAEGFRFEVIETGVGNLEAALRIQRRLLDRTLPEVKEIIFFGSAGFYPSRTQENDIVGRRFGSASVFHSVEIAVTMGHAKVPPPLLRKIEIGQGAVGNAFSRILSPLKGECNSPDSITLIDSLSSRILNEGNRNILFENMEAFGIARASTLTPASFFFAITNFVDPLGSKEWSQNYQRMSEELQQAFLDFVFPSIV